MLISCKASLKGSIGQVPHSGRRGPRDSVWRVRRNSHFPEGWNLRKTEDPLKKCSDEFTKGEGHLGVARGHRGDHGNMIQWAGGDQGMNGPSVSKDFGLPLISEDSAGEFWSAKWCGLTWVWNNLMVRWGSDRIVSWKIFVYCIRSQGTDCEERKLRLPFKVTTMRI